MPESGEWFSPRTRPEMLTSDDPPIQNEKHDRLEILPGPATIVGRVIAPVRRAVAFVPELGRRVIRVDDEPSRWQLAGMWTTGSAIVAGTGLAVAAVLGGAPPALTQQFDRLSVLPGLNESQSDDAPAPAADNAKGDSARTSSGGTQRSSADGSSGSSSGSSSFYDGYSGVPGVPAGASFPDGVVLPGLPASGGAAGAAQPGASNPIPPAGGSGATAPAPGDSPTPPADDPPPVVVDPTDTPPPTEDPTTPPDPVPTEDPTTPPDPVPTDDPTPPEVQPADPTAEPPQADPVADPPIDNPVDSPPADPPPAPVPDPQGTPTP